MMIFKPGVLSIWVDSLGPQLSEFAPNSVWHDSIGPLEPSQDFYKKSKNNKDIFWLGGLKGPPFHRDFGLAP